MNWEEIVKNFNEEVINDIKNWEGIFLVSIEKLKNGYEEEGKRKNLKKDYYPNEKKLVELFFDFRNSLALMILEYQLLFNYKGIEEAKILAVFLYHLLRILPFNNLNRKMHIKIFLILIDIIRQKEKKIEESVNIHKIKDKIFICQFDYNNFCIDSIYLILKS